MSFSTIEDSLLTLVRTEIEDLILAALGFSLPISYPNAPSAKVDNAIWAEVESKKLKTSQVTVGATLSRRFRNPGQLIFRLYDVLNTGDERLTQAADFIANAFRAQTKSGNLVFATPGLDFAGRDAKHTNFYRVDVICPYRVDEFF